MQTHLWERLDDWDLPWTSMEHLAEKADEYEAKSFLPLPYKKPQIKSHTSEANFVFGNLS